MAAWWKTHSPCKVRSQVTNDDDGGVDTDPLAPSSTTIGRSTMKKLEDLSGRIPYIMDLIAKGGDFNPNCAVLKSIHNIVQDFIICLLSSTTNNLIRKQLVL